MNIKIRLAAMSHLSDLQETSDPEKSKKIDFVKLLIMQLEDDRETTTDKLDDLWNWNSDRRAGKNVGNYPLL